MNKQFLLFNNNDNGEAQYTKKISAPIYEPKHRKPQIIELYNDIKAKKLISEIINSNIDECEKQFLLCAASRHIVFNYELVADYYSHASKEMQKLMEDSALVIIDFDSAIERGFVKLCEQIKTQYLEEYNEIQTP